jgi:hypothetical protein
VPLIQHNPADPRIHPSVFNGKTPCSGTKYTSNNGDLAPLSPPAPPPPAKVVVAYGNGSGFHALRHSPPSPTTGLRKRLCAKAHQGLVVIDTPEYRSSKMCSHCKETVEKDPTRTRVQIQRRHIDEEIQVRLPEKVPLWGIRRCNSATCGGFRRWNRDHNAAINIRDNLRQYLASGTWPQRVAGISTTTTTTTTTTTSVDVDCNHITHNVL